MKDKTKKTLKNLLFASLISLASCLPMKKANAQIIPEMITPNTVYLIFHPGDLGLGMRYDRRFNKKLYQFGAYSSASKGNYMLGEGCYVKDHVKFGLGGIFYPENPSFKESGSFFGFGISHHDYGEKVDTFGIINEKRLHSFSIDLSGGISLENFKFFINIDPLKLEGGVGAGLSFGTFSKNPLRRYRRLLAKNINKNID